MVTCTYEYYREAIQQWTPDGFETEVSLSRKGLECVLFPHWYCRPKYAESVQRDMADAPVQFSMKRSFMCKCHNSEIIDYRVNKQLVVFQYQRYIFRTVTGAVASAGPMAHAGNAINQKAFSTFYWIKQLYKLQDVVKQRGLPTLLVTFTINERSFPWCQWLWDDLALQNNLPVDNAVGVTLHGHHVLDQILKGLFAGNVREGRGCPTILRHNRNGRESLECFFYKIEFQMRGTLHVHALYWVSAIEESVLITGSRDDIPEEDPTICGLVRTIQMRTVFVDELRRYSPLLLRVLRSHHDIQYGTQSDLLLTYVTHYVSKAADALDLNKRLSVESAHQAVLGYLSKLSIGLPEMVHTLSDNKSAYFSGLGKDMTYQVPGEKRDETVEVVLYRARDAADEDVSFLSFWRAHCIKVVNGQRVASVYVNEPFVALGINPPKITNELWWEFLVFTEVHHRSDDDLRPADFASLPPTVAYFACAYDLYPDFHNVSTYVGLLVRLGHTKSMISALRMRFQSKVTLLRYCRMNYDRIQQMRIADLGNLPNLRGEQLHVYMECASRMKYFAEHNLDIIRESVDDENYLPDILDDDAVDAINEQRPMVVTGPPGTGKTLLMLHMAFLAIRIGLRVSISSPTGKLASNFKKLLNDPDLKDVITIDTCHATFGFGSNSSRNKPSPVWPNVDVFLVDELSMVTYFHCNHIIRQWECEVAQRRKVLIFFGDFDQLQPLTELRSGHVTTVLSAARSERLLAFADGMELHTNHRSGNDNVLNAFLQACREQRLTAQMCNNFRQGRTFGHRPLRQQDLLDFFIQHEDGVILTMTNRACDEINEAAFEVLAANHPVAMTVTDAFYSPMPIVLGLTDRYLLTSNIDKSADFVNGMLVTPIYVDGKNVLCRTSTGNLVSVYPLYDNDKYVWYYPMRCAFGVTIHKSQGATLSTPVGIYFDCPPLMQKGQAYVAVSRLKSYNQLHIFGDFNHRMFF